MQKPTSVVLVEDDHNIAWGIQEYLVEHLPWAKCQIFPSEDDFILNIPLIAEQHRHLAAVYIKAEIRWSSRSNRCLSSGTALYKVPGFRCWNIIRNFPELADVPIILQIPPRPENDRIEIPHSFREDPNARIVLAGPQRLPLISEKVRRLAAQARAAAKAVA